MCGVPKTRNVPRTWGVPSTHGVPRLAAGRGPDERVLSPCTDQCSLNNGGCSHNCTVAPGEGIVCSCPLGMELGSDNKTCQIQSYCAKHLKCSQKCEQDKYNVKCSCYEGWMLEPDGESCRSLGACGAAGLPLPHCMSQSVPVSPGSQGQQQLS